MAVQKIILEADNLHIKLSLNQDDSLNIKYPNIFKNSKTKEGRQLNNHQIKNHEISILAYKNEIINHLKTLNEPAPF